MNADRASDEALRQGALVAAILGRESMSLPQRFREPSARIVAGLEVYRANALALAERSLAAALPTVTAMLGDEDFGHLAREFWRVRPPRSGDIAEWGGALPDWIRAHPGLAAWPYLGDCAALDLARHHGERARDVEFDAASLDLLERRAPGDLRLVLMPGLTVLGSNWPIVSLFKAHAGPRVELAEARAALRQQRGETALIARQGWRMQVHQIDAACAAWTRELLRGATLADALGGAWPEFDFATWLAQALREAWLCKVEIVA